MDIPDRIKNIKLHAHSYAFVLNFRHGNFDITDLLDFANRERLSGVDIDISDGGENSLKNKSKNELEAVKLYAQKLGLEIDLDINSTFRNDVTQAIDIAKILETRRIRLYTNYYGPLTRIIRKTLKDLKAVAELAEKNDVEFFLEQHEVLKSKEVLEIVEAVGSPRVNLVFDFANMINANEKPLDALKILSPYIQKVHIKDAHRVRMDGGYGQVGASDGGGGIPQEKMLLKLLELGKLEPQVQIYALQQTHGYDSPPYRFDNEDKDPIFPSRAPSDTALDGNLTLQDNLSLEINNAHQQVTYIKKLLKSIRGGAKSS